MEGSPVDSPKVKAVSSMVESKFIGTSLTLHKQDSHRGFYVERGVGNSPKLIRSGSSFGLFGGELKLDTKAKKTMPAAAGAVAAAAVADRMHGPKEDGQLAIVLVLYALSPTAYTPWQECSVFLLKD
eukprot:Gb_23293 [translate_table: standard]